MTPADRDELERAIRAAFPGLGECTQDIGDAVGVVAGHVVFFCQRVARERSPFHWTMHAPLTSHCAPGMPTKAGERYWLTPDAMLKAAATALDAYAGELERTAAGLRAALEGES